jgi:Domain of unknown function (DUF4124)
MTMTTRPPLLLIVAALAVALATTGALAAPYKWVDKDGKTHYSDKPPPAGTKSEQVELKPLTEVNIEPLPPSSDSSGAPPAPVADRAGYRSLTITSPADQATIREAANGLAISVKLEPALSGGDRLEITLDGAVVSQNIPFVERGEHRIGARVVGSDGSERIAAPTVTIFVHQETVPPATPPKPKPKPKKP